jgi:acyl-CoA thioesterase I
MVTYTVWAMVFMSHIFAITDRFRGRAGPGPLAAIIAIFLLAVPVADTMAEDKITVVVLGDSLVAGYGLAPGESFPAQLQARLRQTDADVEIVNAGVSGDTTAGGLSRLEWSVPENAQGVILELGANDALRGLEPDATRQNLAKLIERLKARGQEVLLVGMLAPPNLGREYGDAFRRVFSDLATLYDIPLYPFFLEGVAANPALNLEDGMHPNSAGVAIMVDGVLPLVRQFLADLRLHEDME